MKKSELQKAVQEMDNAVGTLHLRTTNLQDISESLLQLTLDVVEAEHKGSGIYWYARTDHIRRLRTLSDLMFYVMNEVTPAYEKISASHDTVFKLAHDQEGQASKREGEKTNGTQQACDLVSG